MTDQIGLLDTSVVIDLVSLPIEKLPLTGTISAVTFAELSIGPIAAKDEFTRVQRQLRAQAAKSHFNILSFNSHTAQMYATLYQLLHNRGVKARGSRSLDLMIAATAVAHHLPLYTRNPKDFGGLEELLEIVTV